VEQNLDRHQSFRAVDRQVLTRINIQNYLEFSIVTSRYFRAFYAF